MQVSDFRLNNYPLLLFGSPDSRCSISGSRDNCITKLGTSSESSDIIIMPNNCASKFIQRRHFHGANQKLVLLSEQTVFEYT